MAVRIDQRLRERCGRSSELICSGGVFKAPTTYGAPCADITWVKSANIVWDVATVQQLASMPLRSEEELRAFNERARTALPDPMKTTALVLCRKGVTAKALSRELVRLGFDQAAEQGDGNRLARLGVVKLRLPLHAQVLAWLERIDGIALVEDGEREVRLPRPFFQQQSHRSAGPLEGLALTMMGNGAFPDDIDLVFKSQVRVAVIDTGIDSEHPALNGQVEARFDFTDNQQGPLDPHGHGTHVAGTIGGLPPQNAPGLSGIAPFVKLIDVRVFNSSGSATTQSVIEGWACALDQQVDVVNFSGGATYIPADGQSLLSQVVQHIAESGIVCCVSAGNDGDFGEGTISVPSDAPGALSVAAIDMASRRAYFSSMGPSAAPAYTGIKPNIACPGVDLIAPRSQYSQLPPVDAGGYYTAMSGTSMAAPMAAGACALTLGYYQMKGYGADAARKVFHNIQAVAEDVHNEGEKKVGHGIPRVPALLEINPACHGVPLAPASDAVRKQTEKYLDSLKSRRY